MMAAILQLTQTQGKLSFECVCETLSPTCDYVFFLGAFFGFFWWSGTAFQIVSGGQFCQLTNNGQCFTDGAGNYGENDKCVVKPLRDMHL